MNKPVIKIILGIILAIIIVVIIFFVSFQRIYQNKFYSNIFVANINIGGLTKDEANKNVNYQLQTINNREIELNYNDNITSVKPSDLEIQYDLDTSLNAAFNYGRVGPLYQKLINQLKLVFVPKKLIVAFKINSNKLDNIVDDLSNNIDQPLCEASLKLVKNNIQIVEPLAGRQLLGDELKNQLIDTIGNLKDDRSFLLPVQELNPDLTLEDVQRTKAQLEQILLRDLLLEFNNKKFTLNSEKIYKLLELVKYYDKSFDQYQLKILFNEEKIKSYIDSLAKQINQDSQNARLSFDQNSQTLQIISASKDGYTLKKDDLLQLITRIFDELKGNNLGNLQIVDNLILLELPVDITQPEIRENNLTSLGIKEVIATASTNYAGSPENRRHNVATGAGMFQGILIKPNEEFSFLKYLGSVSEERGFKKELVIKQDSTEPEVGGGLCQVSTTMFRVALNAGLKITERTNHKYRVSYYEPPVGLDATIYEPSPDLKFINDFPSYILIESRITNNNTITFTFYGTKDSRVVSISSPELYDYQNPPDAQYIDDPTMNEGETKYKEKAHTGVKTKVTYIVVRDGKEINKQTFYSKYVAWGAVILRGTKKADQPVPTPEPTPTTTPSESPSPSPTPTPTDTSTPTPTPSPSV